MNLLNKCVADNRLHVSRDKGRNSFRTVEQSGRASSSVTRPDGQWASKRTFVEDFTQEHCSFGQHLDSIEISGNF
jgi:hypothetical protein